MMASTMSVCVAVRRSNSATFWPSRRATMRSATSNTSWRLCEIRRTPSPCWPSRRTRSRTRPVCSTPKGPWVHREGRSWHSTLPPLTRRLTGADPQRDSRPAAGPKNRGHAELFEHLQRTTFHAVVVQPAQLVGLFASEEHVLDHAQGCPPAQDPGRRLRCLAPPNPGATGSRPGHHSRESPRC